MEMELLRVQLLELTTRTSPACQALRRSLKVSTMLRCCVLVIQDSSTVPSSAARLSRTGTTRLATSHVGTGAGDHIFAFECDTEDASGQCTIVFDSCDSQFDTIMRVYYTADMRTELASADDDGACGTRAILQTTVNKGNYHVVVEGFNRHEGAYSVFMDCQDTTAVVCQCSGATNTAEEGADCSDVDADGAWCYTERGICVNGAPSSSVAGSDWSYDACLHRQQPPPPPPPIRGCTNAAAINFNPQATIAVDSTGMIHAPPPPPPARSDRRCDVWILLQRVVVRQLPRNV